VADRDSSMELYQCKLMVLHAAYQIENGMDFTAVVSMAKHFVANSLWRIIDRAIQVHGALGYSTDTPLAHMLQQARWARFADGADEIHQMRIAQRTIAAYNDHGTTKAATGNLPRRERDEVGDRSAAAFVAVVPRDVVAEQLVGVIVFPVVQQRHELLGRPLDRHGRRPSLGRDDTLIVQHVEHAGGKFGHRCVRHVRQGDHAQPPAWEPAQRRPVTGEATRMRHLRTQLVLELDAQPVAVAGRCSYPAKRAPPGVRLHRLHLPPARPGQRAGVGAVAGGERVVEPGDPPGEVADRGPDPAHRRDQAVARRRALLDPGVVEPPHRP
jgi:hypothetical protein